MPLPLLLIPMAIGAVAGALTNKRNPLQGAAMGAGMGALGGAGAAAMGIGGAAAGGAAGMGSSLGSGISAGGGLLGASGGAAGGSGLLGASSAGMGEALGSGLSASAGGLSGGMSAMGGMGSGVAGSLPASAGMAAPSMYAQAMGYAQPIGNALSAASSAKSMFTPEKTQITPSPIMTPMPNSNLGQIVSGMQQDQANRLAMDQNRRMTRRQYMRRMA